jgi:hypothetical protein
MRSASRRICEYSSMRSASRRICEYNTCPFSLFWLRK